MKNPELLMRMLKDDQINLRIPKQLKKELKAKWKKENPEIKSFTDFLLWRLILK